MDSYGTSEWGQWKGCKTSLTQGCRRRQGAQRPSARRTRMKGGAHLLASELIEYYSRLWRGLRLCHPGGLPGPLLGQYALKCPGNGQLSLLGNPSDGIMNYTINTLQKSLKYSISIWSCIGSFKSFGSICPKLFLCHSTWADLNPI